jgi:hypothetical protein
VEQVKALVATPFIPISQHMHSHRGAQGVIYADQLQNSGKDITVNMTGRLYHKNFNDFDELYVYHGNDWTGSVNLYGGLEAFPYAYNFTNFSRFKGKVYSIMIDMPDYASDIEHKIKIAKEKEKFIQKDWLEVDFDNLRRMQKTAEVIDPNLVKRYYNISMGDSHAICMYRPGWMNVSVPFKTLHGALKLGLKNFIPANQTEYKKLEFYFGNIDIRHHLVRQPDPKQAIIDLVDAYFKQASEFNAEVSIYEPLPIENESRTIPKTGWYKGTPFFGSWEQRDDVRSFFIEECLKRQGKVKFFSWTAGLMNERGELDFKFMEKPKSVHLNRAYYPHWTGETWNGIERNTLEDFFL